MKTLLTLALVLNAFIGFSQSDTTMVPFVSYWSLGDSYNFQVTKVKQRYKEGNLTKNDSTVYVANWQVVDSTETMYRIKWTYETDLKKYKLPENILNGLSKYSTTEVVYTTSEVGEFKEIENWEEISKKMTSLFSELISEGGQGDAALSAELEKAFKPMMAMYSSKEGIEQLVFKELMLFHFPFGLEYPKDEVIEYEDKLPNMMGGSPIRGNSKLYFEEVDFDDSYCVMVKEMELNPEDTEKMILTVMKKMGIKKKDLKKVMNSSKFVINDKTVMQYYYYPGVPLRIETTRVSDVDINSLKQKGVEITILELVD